MRTRSAKQAAKRVGRPIDPYDYSEGNRLSTKRRAELTQDLTNGFDANYLADLHAEDPEMYRRFLASAARQKGPLNCVYFIRMGTTDAIKVGKAWNGLTRCLQLQVSSPLQLEFAAFVSFIDETTMHFAELFAHNQCRQLGIGRLKGEWFNMNRAQIEAVYENLMTEYHGKIVGAVRKWDKS
ncbi:hypothetical protein [Aureimonas glaciei]|uniref:Uncharacterized protein n=1 Tax=Aureimonas glaciei TaxID=1776957 RepID=A0A916Y4Q4_9HYPH|nr:hypothetical protein [Aureimonas glaciei]GGD30887.1 hypothetical protein GCM10011335_37430 [Aureimonas glaciei]